MGGKIGAGARGIFFAIAISLSTGLINFESEQALSKVELDVEYDNKESLDSLEDSELEKSIIEEKVGNKEPEPSDKIEEPNDIEVEPERLEPEIIDNSEVEDLELKLIEETVLEEEKEYGNSKELSKDGEAELRD